MADRIVVMRDGRVEQIGAPLDLYDRPGNLFVADFLGSPSMNFIEGTIRRIENAPELVTQDGTSLALPETLNVADNQRVILGIRPEHLSLTEDGQSVAATVQVVEPTGANVEVFFEFAGQDLCAVFNERYPLKPKDRVSLTWAPGNMHLFDKESGNRI